MYSMNWWRLSPTQSCTPEDLAEILTRPTGGYFVLPGDPYNEVFSNIFIGDGTTALCKSLLRRLGITHVVNAACGKDRHVAMINTSKEFYRSSNIDFFGIEALDLSIFPISNYFESSADFIEEALKSGGKVLVHCGEGISRSATIVLAYLMIKKGMSVQEAVEQVRAHRAIIPNVGFLKQLCQLNDLMAGKRRQRRGYDEDEMRKSRTQIVVS